MPITGFADAQKWAAQYGYIIPFYCTSPAQAAAGASPGIPIGTALNNIGTASPGTLVGLTGEGSNASGWTPGMTERLCEFLAAYNGSAIRGVIGWLYKIGTSTWSGGSGDNFTHDAATFPILRTVMGQASTAISLVPLIYVTTAFASGTAAPTYIMKNAAVTQGYVNQDGATVVGTRSCSFGTNNPTAGPAMLHAMEDGDSAVRDIQAVNVTVTNHTAGTIAWWGWEPITPVSLGAGGLTWTYDALAGQLSSHDMKPGVATTGTATTLLVIVLFGGAGSGQFVGVTTGFPDV